MLQRSAQRDRFDYPIDQIQSRIWPWSRSIIICEPITFIGSTRRWIVIHDGDGCRRGNAKVVQIRFRKKQLILDRIPRGTRRGDYISELPVATPGHPDTCVCHYCRMAHEAKHF